MGLREEMGLARDLFGSPRSTAASAATATATADSSNGQVEIQYDGDTETMVVDCIGSVEAGQEVDVIIRDGGSTYVTGAKGWGDSIQVSIDAATAKTAYITHVESGSDAGLHVHEVKDGDQTPGAEPYDEGSDLWLNPSAIVFKIDGDVAATLDTLTVGGVSEARLTSEAATVIGSRLESDNALNHYDRSAGVWAQAENFAEIHLEASQEITRTGFSSDSSAILNVTAGEAPLYEYRDVVTINGNEDTNNGGQYPLLLGVFDYDTAVEKMICTDWPLAHGTETVGNTTWDYTIYASGKVECWGKTSTITTAITNAWGSIYFAGALGSANYPSGLFSSVSYTRADWIGENADTWSGEDNNDGTSTTAPPKVYAYSAVKVNSHTGYIRYYARGMVGSINY